MTVTTQPPATTETGLPRAIAFRRWAVVGATALSGVLIFVSMLIDPAPGSDDRALLAAYSADTVASGWHSNLIHYGFALGAPMAYGMIYLVRRRGAALANVAWVFAVIGLSTLPGLMAYDFFGVAAVQATDLDTAMAISERIDASTGFSLMVAPAFLCSVLAVPLAVAALVRSGLLGWPALLVAVLTFAAPNAGPTWWISFGTHAVGCLVLAWFVARIPAREWDHPVVQRA